MKIAYCSPFSPVKSGISDFSEELVREMKKHVDIDLFYDIAVANRDIADNFNFYNICDLADDDFASQYSLAVYHMGNNYNFHRSISDMFWRRPGVLELHDVSLHDYVAAELYSTGRTDEYFELIRYCHGESGLQKARGYFDDDGSTPWGRAPMELTVNKRYIDHALGVIVHSEYAKQIVKGIRPSVPVICIPLHVEDQAIITDDEKKAAKKHFSIDEDCFVFGSFGYVTKAKRLYETFEALAKFDKDFRFVIVGKVLEGDIDLEKKAEELGIADKVIIPGFVSLDEYKLYMQACDICINLRYPTHGESSANLQRILGCGIPAIVTDIGAFSEYPDSCTVKVPYGEGETDGILSAIRTITENRDVYENYKKSSVEYIRENADIKRNCELYADFFREVVEGSFVERKSMIDRMLDVATENGFSESGFLMSLCDRLKFER